MRDDALLVATDGSLLLAIPAFAPAILIAGVVIVIAVRSRRRDPDGPVEADAESQVWNVSRSMG